MVRFLLDLTEGKIQNIVCSMFFQRLKIEFRICKKMGLVTLDESIDAERLGRTGFPVPDIQLVHGDGITLEFMSNFLITLIAATKTH